MTDKRNGQSSGKVHANDWTNFRLVKLWELLRGRVTTKLDDPIRMISVRGNPDYIVNA
jgi:hypothetical protein